MDTQSQIEKTTSQNRTFFVRRVRLLVGLFLFIILTIAFAFAWNGRFGLQAVPRAINTTSTLGQASKVVDPPLAQPTFINGVKTKFYALFSGICLTVHVHQPLAHPNDYFTQGWLQTDFGCAVQSFFSTIGFFTH